MAQQINLFNPIFLKQKRYFSATAMAQAVGLIVIGVLAIYALQVRQTRALERVAAEAQKQLDERRAQIAVFARQTAGDKIKAELDELLDEIDDVLETNAEDFVKSYIQKGGE